jgi:hypothetical protein
MNTIDTRAWHARYAALDALADQERLAPLRDIKGAIDGAWDAIAEAFKAHGYTANNSDGAEEVVAVLTRYLFLSNAENDLIDHASLLIDAAVLERA